MSTCMCCFQQGGKGGIVRFCEQEYSCLCLLWTSDLTKEKGRRNRMVFISSCGGI